MILEFYKKLNVIDKDGLPQIMWKFKDENGNIWNAGTGVDGTEEDAASIILGSVVSA